MPGLLSRMFRRKAASDAKKSSKKLNSETSLNGHITQPQLDVWEQPSVRREDVVELLKACCDELKARGTAPGLITPEFTDMANPVSI